MTLLKKTPLIFIVLIFFCGCNSRHSSTEESKTPLSTPTRIVPDPGLGGIIGIVENAGNIWPGRNLMIYAAEFYGDSDEGGMFLLETTKFPKSILSSDFFFQINNIPPKYYVLLVGPNPEASLFIKFEGVPLIVEVIADEIVDLGVVTISE